MSPYVEHLHMIPESGLLACPCGARKHAPTVIFEIGERESAPRGLQLAAEVREPPGFKVGRLAF